MVSTSTAQPRWASADPLGRTTLRSPTQMEDLAAADTSWIFDATGLI